MKMIRSLVLGMVSIGSFNLQAKAGEIVNQQTFKCFTDDYEPGQYYQVTFGFDAEGRIGFVDNGILVFQESPRGEILNERSLSTNIPPKVLDDGSLRFVGLDRFEREFADMVTLTIKKLETEIKWPLMTGKVQHGDTNYDVTCAFIGGNAPKH
jgi:hypothetical protein